MIKKRYPFFITLIGGAVMIVVSLLINNEALKALSGVLIGVGAGLIGMSLSVLVGNKYLRNHPVAAKQAEIESKDERNILIRAHAKAAAADVTHWFIIALAFVLIFIDAPLWVTLCTVAVFLLYYVLTFVFMARFQKRM